MTTGMDLKLKRVARRVRVIDIARAMNVQHPRISHIEASASVTPETVARYLAALDSLANVETSGVA